MAVAVTAFATLHLNTSPAAASQNSTWSFEEHPHPLYDELTEEEKKNSDVLAEYPLDGMSPCEADLLATYEIYLRRYPGFQKRGNARTNFTNWKNYIAHQKQNRGTLCMYKVPFRRLDAITFEPYVRKDFYFCGQYSRIPYTPLEHDAYLLIEEAISYAKTGHWSAVTTLVASQGEDHVIDLNPDIEYYFRKLIYPFAEDVEQDRDTSHLEPMLSAERIRFLDDAVTKRDFEAVVDTTPQCKTRADSE